MKTHRNAERLIEYMREHQPTTATRVVMDGVMNARDVSGAIRHGMRHGVLERVKRGDASPGERFQYRLTGRALPPDRTEGRTPSFDALLVAWGIRCAPPQWPDERKRVVVLD